MNRYDDGARLVFHFAREEGEKLGHAMISPEHLLLGLLREGGNASRVLADFGATLEGLRRQVEEMVGRGDGLPRNETAAITPRARRVMELAGLEAEQLGSRRIRTEHILLAIIRCGEGPGFKVLRALVKDPEVIRHRISEAAVPEPDPSEGVSPRLRLNPDGWSETFVGAERLSPVMELKLGLRLLGRGARHLLLGR
jgi:ATP-dependent Clp protease ATP-binding subunit ClpC